MTHLLIVSEDHHFCATLHRSLKSKSYRATIIANADVLPAALAIHRPDMVLLDMASHFDDSSLEICRRLRGWNPVPIIISSLRDDTPTKVKALDAGADDYLVKPFDTDELLARVRAVQRRLSSRSGQVTPVLRMGKLMINFDTRIVSLDETPIHLTHKEYELLKALVLARGQTLTYRMLLEKIGGKQDINERSAIRTIAKRLRSKLGDDRGDLNYILNESGLGYRFNPLLLIED